MRVRGSVGYPFSLFSSLPSPCRSLLRRYSTRNQHSRPSSHSSPNFHSSASPSSLSPSPSGIIGPWVKLKYVSNAPCIFPSMIQSQNANPGDFVTILDKEGKKFGYGIYDPKAKIPLRVYFTGKQNRGEEDMETLLQRAVQFRLNTAVTDKDITCYRVINAEGDNLSGFIVDKYGEFLSVSVYSYGVYLRLKSWLSLLHSQLGTKYEIVQHEIKGSQPAVLYSPKSPQREKENEKGEEKQNNKSSTIVQEYDNILFHVNFETGHKTGFFCDQRENRKKIQSMARGKRVIDLCCYTGGFSIYAAKGGATEVIGVDLDEKAIAQAKANSLLNKLDFIQWEHADSFAYSRMLRRQNKLFDMVILDPPKFITGTTPEAYDEGTSKYFDLNLQAMELVMPGGLFVTCSCSGRLSMADFESIVIKAAHKLNKRLQILDKTGPGMDHPLLSNFLEGSYLKVIWTRVLWRE